MNSLSIDTLVFQGNDRDLNNVGQTEACLDNKEVGADVNEC